MKSFPYGVSTPALGGVEIYTGTVLPTLGTVGFPKGSIFYLKNAAGTILGKYKNRGTATAACFNPYDFSQVSSGEVMGTGTITNIWPTSTKLSWGLAAQADAAAIFTYTTSDDTDRIVAVTPAITGIGGITAKFIDPLSAHSANAAALRLAMSPDQIKFKVVYGAQFTTVGGAAAEAITITGVKATDVAFVGKKSGAQTLVKAVCTADTLTVTFSADPTTANVIYYVILRQATEATVESHVCVFAGQVAATAGGTSNAKTVTGVLATDLVFGDYATTDDTDTLTSVAATANTITYVMSADPLAAHSFNYAVFRAV